MDYRLRFTSAAFSPFQTKLTMTGKVKILTASIVVILTASILSIPAILEFSARTGLAALRKEGISLRAENLRGSLIGMSADQIHYTIPIPTGKRFPTHIPFPLMFSEVNATVSVRPLKQIIPRITLAAEVLNGHMNATVVPGFQGSSIHGTIDDVDLSSHPLLRGFGIRKGLITVSFSELIVGTESPSASHFAISLNAILVDLKNVLPSIIPLEMLEISNAKMEGAMLESGKIDLTSISLTSNVASLEGRVNGRISRERTLENLSGTVDIHLTGRDSHTLQRWLPLLTGEAVSSSRQSLSCTLFSVQCNSSAQLRLNSRQCLTYRCH